LAMSPMKIAKTLHRDQQRGQDKRKRTACHREWRLHKVWRGTKQIARVPWSDVEPSRARLSRVPCTLGHDFCAGWACS
jgi:hypothetical protein